MKINPTTENRIELSFKCQSSSSEGPKHDLFADLFRVLQNQDIGGTKDVSVATIYRTCFGPSELKLSNF
ncbi:hypothetical protein BpHYR1_004021 [Brachionus plicatilis]|uniref:Uncharacterized protein n=1 Tax=Brachionus plicatilis TaxID=10195 RepID=A0A3M7T118_BRAPC|nr:hypothetical protein BpHYR1_004021 [Brachionus plicatilis]